MPAHLLREYREGLRLSPTKHIDSFDQDHGVETEGELDGWTYLSDLEIPSANWIHGNNYIAIEPARFREAVAKLPIRFEDFVFVDFGSGKGRALLMASELPFKRVVGVEFSPELHAIAQSNIRRYRAAKGGSLKLAVTHEAAPRIESVCMDFLEFPLPLEPSVYFLYDPCDGFVLGKLISRIGASLRSQPRQIQLVYLAPARTKEQMLDASEFLIKATRNSEHNFCIYHAA